MPLTWSVCSGSHPAWHWCLSPSLWQSLSLGSLPHPSSSSLPGLWWCWVSGVLLKGLCWALCCPGSSGHWSGQTVMGALCSRKEQLPFSPRCLAVDGEDRLGIWPISWSRNLDAWSPLSAWWSDEAVFDHGTLFTLDMARRFYCHVNRAHKSWVLPLPPLLTQGVGPAGLIHSRGQRTEDTSAARGTWTRAKTKTHFRCNQFPSHFRNSRVVQATCWAPSVTWGPMARAPLPPRREGWWINSLRTSTGSQQQRL